MTDMQRRPKLSICIATYNRADLLQQALESVISQLTDECELVVSDNASTDHTPHVVAALASRPAAVRYFRQETNIGLDRNFDAAVAASRGDYCWFFSDDDVMKPGAIARVLSALEEKICLVLVNIEYRTVDMSTVLRPTAMRLKADRLYGPDELDRLFVDADSAVGYLGAVVIRRALWLARNRERYYGSMFVQVGTVFQEPLPGDALIIAEPLISYRLGNTPARSTALSDALVGAWPAVIESLALSVDTKRRVVGAQPWKQLNTLLGLRARGLYSWRSYQLWIRPRVKRMHERLPAIAIAFIPGVMANAICVLHSRARGDQLFLYLMRASRYHLCNLPLLGRAPR